MWPWLVGIAVVILSGVRVAQEYERGVVFRLGRYVGTRGPGLFYLLPFVERQAKIDIRTQTVNVEPQETITKDSVTIKVNAVLWYKISDPSRSIVKVYNYRDAVYQVALTTLRNVLGQHLLDEILRDRDKINETILQIVEESTSTWGIEVEMVEMKDVEIPPTMQRVMAMEAEAMREKRARLIKAEAEQEASIKLSEAAAVIATNPAALELRRMQMISEVGAGQNTTTVIMMPSEFVSMAKGVGDYLGQQTRLTEEQPESQEVRVKS